MPYTRPLPRIVHLAKNGLGSNATCGIDEGGGGNSAQHNHLSRTVVTVSEYSILDAAHNSPTKVKFVTVNCMSCPPITLA